VGDATGAGDARQDRGEGDGTAVDDGSTADTDVPPNDAGCSALGPIPDGAPRTIYGSCLGATKVICTEHGYTSDLGVTPLGLQIQKNTCSSLGGAWADGPCARDAAVFGCESVGDDGHVCATLSITWFFPPSTVADEEAGCPPSVGTVIPP
jgi:hypothetical protein